MNHGMLRSWLLSRGAAGSAPTLNLRSGFDLQDRLDRMRSPITAYVLGQRSDEAALGKILDWRDLVLLPAHVRAPSGSVSKYPPTSRKSARGHPALKRPRVYA